MKSIDEFISDILEKEINTPLEYRQMIRNTINLNNKSKLPRLVKSIITAIIGFSITSGFVFAGYIAYEKIWKEPKQYNTYQGMINSMPSSEISVNEKEEIILKEEVKKIAISFIETLGYNNQNIEAVELERNYDSEEKSYYLVKTKQESEKGLIIIIDAKSGNIEYFNDLELKYKNLFSDLITEDNAREKALEICKKLKLENEYELNSIIQEESLLNDTQRSLWNAKFIKKDSKVYNKYEICTVGFMIVNNEILYDTVHLNNNIKEVNNPTVVKERDAIDIAVKKEKQFTYVDITSSKAELSIEKMNTFVYQLEHEIYNTDPGNDGIYLKINKEARKVWKVTIEHNNKRSENEYNNYNQYIKENYDKEYYIDATTGEIIGGDICKKHI